MSEGRSLLSLSDSESGTSITSPTVSYINGLLEVMYNALHAMTTIPTIHWAITGSNFTPHPCLTLQPSH